MTSVDQPEETPLQTRIKRAEEMILGAVAELAANRFNNAVNRAYYACFHIGVGLRMLASDEPERTDPGDRRPLWTHSGTMNRLRQILEARGLSEMDPSPASIFGWRTRADYYTETPVNGVSLESARDVVNQVLRLRALTLEILPWDHDDKH